MLYSATTSTMKVLGMKSRIRAVPGGTSASKTISILLTLIDAAQNDEVPTLTSVVSESLPHLRRGAMRDFLNIMKGHRYFREDQWNRTGLVYTFESGSEIEFFGADQAEKLRGGRRDRLFINEANNVRFSAFEELEVRTREYVYIDWNPTSEFWYYTDVRPKRSDVEEVTLTYKDNEALDKNTIAAIEQRKNRPGWWKVYGLGQLGEVEGRIYTGWDIVECVPEEARLLRYGLDFGYTNDPSTAVAIHYLDGGFILDEVFYEKGLANKKIADRLECEDAAPVIADSAEPKSIDEISGYGIDIRPSKKGPGSVNQGIQFVQDQKIAVTSRSVNIIREYRNYLWKTDKNGKSLNEPEHEYSHSMDAVRYGLAVDVEQEPTIRTF